MICLLGYYNDENIINTKTLFLYFSIKSFLNYFPSKMILLNILQDVAIYLFKYFALHIKVIFSKSYISILWNNDVYKTFA